MMPSAPLGCAPPEGAFRGSPIGSGGVCMCSLSHPLPDGQPSISPPVTCHHDGVQQVGIHERVTRGSLRGYEWVKRESGGVQVQYHSSVYFMYIDCTAVQVLITVQARYYCEAIGVHHRCPGHLDGIAQLYTRGNMYRYMPHSCSG